MNQNYANGALAQYQQIGAQAAVAGASPHALIHLLLQGGLERIAKAKGFMLHGDVQKGGLISQAISIVDGLRNALDLKVGGEIAENLDNLYDYCQRRLLQANLDNDPAILDEVSSLLQEIRGAWDAIPFTDRDVCSDSRVTAG
ncbi:MAG: flagellar export chaperone FliS [Gammaproteobacteria bacterium]|nr:flagellar export chaperone FliS [Gammaproteobacteria bacterium]